MLEEVLWVVLGVAVVYLLKKYFEPAPPPRKITPKAPIVERAYTIEEIRACDGSKSTTPILIAIKGKVYDVSRGRQSYGPQGPYHVFAGHDASVALGKGSLDASDLDKDYTTLNPSEMSSLNEWIAMYETKYERVGWIATSGEKQQ